MRVPRSRPYSHYREVTALGGPDALDGEMLSTEYESLDSVMAMLREECATSGGQLDGPRYTRVAKLLRELLLDPEKERQHRADVQRLSREQRDALYSPKFERAPAAAGARLAPQWVYVWGWFAARGPRGGPTRAAPHTPRPGFFSHV